MGKKLYVGNLPYSIDSSGLQELFTAHGTVESAEIIADRETGRSKGFGFVQMGSDDEATAAIPNEFADEVALVGPPARIRDRLGAWKESGVTTLIAGLRHLDALRTLAESVS